MILSHLGPSWKIRLLGPFFPKTLAALFRSREASKDSTSLMLSRLVIDTCLLFLLFLRFNNRLASLSYLSLSTSMKGFVYLRVLSYSFNFFMSSSLAFNYSSKVDIFESKTEF